MSGSGTPTTPAAPPDAEHDLERLASVWALEHASVGLEKSSRTQAPPTARLAEMTRKLARAHKSFGAAAATDTGSYAAEWFLDNYYLIRESIRQASQDLPTDFFRRLPCLGAGAVGAGSARAEALGVLLLDECSGRLDVGRAGRLVEAYQVAMPLTMGELWALPSLLRLVLLDWLTQSAERLTASNPLEDGVERETNHQRVADCIVGLRVIKNTDWRVFFEAASLCERELRKDASGDYGRMTFETRDRYRKVVERVARRTGADEVAVASAAVGLSQSADESAPRRTRHVGYYLIDCGAERLEAAFGYRRPAGEAASAWLKGHPTLVYLGSIGSLAASLLLLGGAYAAFVGADVRLVVLAVALLVVPAFTVAVSVVNYVLNRLLRPTLLPRLDFSDGLPDRLGALVVIPALVAGPEELDALLGQLERHYLGNPDPRLSFALVTDFPDGPSPTAPGEAALLEHARERLERMNAAHGRTGEGAGARFYLLHRGRRWNASQGVWMGWERKRGKLMELNRLLRGATDTSFEFVAGDVAELTGTEYVLTLDADTRLPPGAAVKLIGTLAHPLNRAEFGEDGRVVAGYSLLQPRTDVLPESANASRFSRLFVGEMGLDLYTHAVSDVYQDLFGAAIFVGKGLYRVDDFQRALAGRVPENSLLSHDLLEGIYGGVALVSDVVLFEEYPPTYLAQVNRAQRWVRGDWQLLPWLLATLIGVRGRGERLGPVGAWKIADNLRRSLVAPALAALFLAGWLILPGSPAVWTLIALSTLAAPLLAGAVIAYLEGLIANYTVPGRRRLMPWQPLSQAFGRFAITVSFVPYEAGQALRSIGLTLYRLFVTHRNLLEWRTAALTNREPRPTLLGNVRRMWAALAATLLAAVAVALLRPNAAAAALLLVWLLAPLSAHLLSLTSDGAPREPTDEERRELHGLARRTWLYFERFVGPQDNWLPPDNVQLGAKHVTAHRTSPTNVGLMLLSTLAAHDLGYLGLVDLSLRLRQTFDVLGRLERYRGHLLNWYDTRSLEPLNPRYVSSVDSGNFAASLVALRQGCLQLLERPVDVSAVFRGLEDTLAVLEDALFTAMPERPAAAAAVAALRERVAAAVGARELWPATIALLEGDAWQAVEEAIVTAMRDEELTGPDLEAVRLWAERVRHGIKVTLGEVGSLAPWARAPGSAEAWTRTLHEGSDAQAAWLRVEELFSREPPLRDTGAWAAGALDALSKLRAALPDDHPGRAWCAELAARVVSARSAASGLARAFEELAARGEAEVLAMDFAFLLDHDRQLLHIGYNVDTEQLDANHYDLLASEARLASLVAVAKGDAPISHWVHLNRPLGDLGGRAALLSWSGTMFEYLMPELLTRRYGATLLDQSCAAAIDVQIAYAKRNGVPWGVSESGYARVDAAGNYQYHAFGVPELALNRSYSNDLVIAPYASVLALRHRPRAVLENAARLAEAGALGPHGFFEALDYTPERRPLGEERVVVRSHMAHHQGMTLLALTNALTGDAMVERFHADPRVATIEYLLQERIPLDVPVVDDLRPEASPSAPIDVAVLDEPWDVPVDTATPLRHLLSNGAYTVMVSEAGGGWSAAGEVAITRWRPDGTRDADGTWLFIHDEGEGLTWSPTRAPLPARAQGERVEFYPYKARYQREVGGILARLEVTVAKGTAELRRLTVVNRGETSRTLRVTSYAEVVLGPVAADARHPAFSKLFVESAFLPRRSAILFRRRPRSADEPALFAAHAVVCKDDLGPCEYETDRAAFLGRGNDVAAAVGPRGPLRTGGGPRRADDRRAGEKSATLDPAMALAVRFDLRPHSQEELTFVTASGASSRDLTTLLDELRKPGMVDREFDLARLRSRVELQEHDLTPSAVETYQRLYSAVTYPVQELRAPAATLAANTLGQPSLWGQGISGDLPIVLVSVGSAERLPLVDDVLRAHAYWRRRGVKVDVVLLNLQDTAYDQALHARLRSLLVRSGSDAWLAVNGGVHLLRRDQLAPLDLVLLESAAAVVLDGERGSLAEQLRELGRPPRPGLPLLVQGLEPMQGPSEGPAGTVRLRYDNGWGGFTEDGREYVIRARRGSLPPAPWSNVIANAELGCLVTEAGMGATWAVNSGENRLTPWSNDPVTDPGSEIVYLRDEETTEVWSATPQPAGGEASFEVRHGAGRTLYRHVSHGLEHALEVSVAARDPVKLVRLHVRNLSGRPRRVTVTYYAEWVLGVDRRGTGLHVVPDYAPERCTLLARNPYSTDFGARVAFLAGNKSPHGVTTDRREFIGRLGSYALPDALRRVGLAGAVAPGADPCAAMQLHLDLAAGASEDVLFALGQADDRDAALRLADRYRDLGAYAVARRAADEAWDAVLGKVQVSTPDHGLDLLTNRWLLYQTLSSRCFGRTAFYQPGGAYGFRDQLQDVVALLHAAPELAREQLLRAAAHQFPEGDVLHWWHPPAGRGVRTHISDDLLWLVYTTERYVSATGDRSVLDEEAPFLEGRPLAPDVEDRYDAYRAGSESGTLLEHCRRALRKGATAGSHGLPLMGTGDWNDGMNRVGADGRGESVWLAWFLIDVIGRFRRLLDSVGGHEEEAAGWAARAGAYAHACEEAGWDGSWYLRAFYDDGTPLGTAAASEWRIDSIAQSWAVLSGAAPAERAATAMAAVEELCVRRQDGLIRLATPPFDRSKKDPGYIKGYVPGVRENGGQYTHGAIWSAWAFARLGERGKAYALHRLLDPVLRAGDREGAERYVVEPYVMAADVYERPPHVGRGGWTWYTGSAAWFYRFGLEGLLGLERVGDELRLTPRVPTEWPGFEVRYRHGSSTYVLRARPGAIPANQVVKLRDDGGEHVVDVVYEA